MYVHPSLLRSMEYLLPPLRRLPWFLPLVTLAGSRLCIQRRAGLVGADRALCARLEASLAPLDILLTRARFKLSDKLIPGYFTHAAVFIGRDAAWIARPQGQGAGPEPPAVVIEAVRTGVQVVTLGHFLDVDTVAVLRDPRLSDERRGDALRRARLEIGKQYDYRFDIADRRRQFCSKLVASLFPHLPLDPAARARGIILPDDIARLAAVSPPVLYPVWLSVDGGPVCAGPDPETMAQLLGGVRWRYVVSSAFRSGRAPADVT